MKINHLFPLGILVFVTACGQMEPKVSGKENTYFDLRGYFSAEASRLQRKNPRITKTVLLNGQKEKKILSITDWNKELGSFIDADINKPAWKGEFSRTVRDGAEIYTTDNEKIPVSRLELESINGQIKAVKVILRTRNSLYEAADTLIYLPDSLYQISKSQKIRLIRQKHYLIRGIFPVNY